MPGALQIRTAIPEDEQIVRDLLTRSYSLLLPPYYDPAAMAEAMPILTTPDAKLLGSGRYYIAETEGAAVACGGWSVELPPGANLAQDAAVIRRFAVVPELAGKGIGRRLFERCEVAIRALKLTRMLVRSSLNAEPFYAALGFRPLHPIDMPLPGGGGFPCILMQRDF